jgi:hypothetical protein
MNDLAALSLDELHELRGRVAGRTLEQVNELIQARVPVPTEKEVQRRIVKRLGEVGCAVYSTSQARASKVSAGIPDLICIDPHHGIFVVEVKAEGGKQRPEQRVFQERWEQAGGKYILGGLAEVEAFLKSDPFPEDDDATTPVPF